MPPTGRPPNVVVIFADDLGYADLGCYGSNVPTPNLDRMAKQGVRFTSLYSAQAVCSASRAALLTGCYPNRVSIRGALHPNSDVGINPDEHTLAEVLKTRGYATGIFGKWHLGDRAQFLPTHHGFDEYLGLPYSNDMRKTPQRPADYPELPLIEGTKVARARPGPAEAHDALHRAGRQSSSTTTRTARSSSTSRTPCRTCRWPCRTSSRARARAGCTAT